MRLRKVDGRQIVSGVYIEAERVTADLIRRVPLARIEAEANAGHDTLLPDAPPSREGLTSEEFSRLIAEHFLLFRGVTPNPAAAMSERWGIKRPTIAGWIREARLRGFLAEPRRAQP